MAKFKRPQREPDIEAEIAARPTIEGGRMLPIFSGYLPSHNFGLEGILHDAMHEYPESGSITPGEKAQANLWFLTPEYQEGRLFIGMEFTIQEGERIIGMGKITKICNPFLFKRF